MVVRNVKWKWYRGSSPSGELRIFCFEGGFSMDQSAVHFAHRFDNVSGSAIREIFKIIAQPGMISFAGGNPSLNALPDRLVSELAVDVLAQNGKAILQYGATEGYAPFLESLHAYAADMLKCEITAVLPVTGSTQAMDLLCKAMIDPGDTILVENPSFLGNLQCMKLYQANLVPVESDGDGLLPDDLEAKIRQHHPKMLYTIPTFQNPTGKTLPADRRRRIAELANEYHVVVVLLEFGRVDDGHRVHLVSRSKENHAFRHSLRRVEQSFPVFVLTDIVEDLLIVFLQRLNFFL